MKPSKIIWLCVLEIVTLEIVTISYPFIAGIHFKNHAFLLSFSYLFVGILAYTIVMLYTRKYNLVPFYHKWFSENLKKYWSQK